jgi:hypothetical protein
MRYPTLFLAFLLAPCTAALAQPMDAKKLKDQLSGDAKISASNNPQCKLFTQREIETFLGAAVGPGENAAGGSGCSWVDKSYEAQAIVTVVPESYFPEPKLVKGFKRLPAIGKRAWVAPDDGWSAGTVEGGFGIVVGLSGKKATEGAVIALLQETVKRRKK